MHILMIAVIRQVCIRILSCHLLDSGIHSSHELIHMVKAQSSPSIVLSGLDEYIRILDSCTEHSFLKLAPIVFATIESAHVMHIHLSDILLGFPFISSIDQFLNSCVVPTLQASKNTLSGHLSGLFWGYSCCYQFFFYIHTTSTYFISISLLR